MPNQPSVHTRILSVQVPRDLYYAVRLVAARRGVGMAAFIRSVLAEAAGGDPLPPAVLATIRRETAAARSRRCARTSFR